MDDKFETAEIIDIASYQTEAEPELVDTELLYRSCSQREREVELALQKHPESPVLAHERMVWYHLKMLLLNDIQAAFDFHTDFTAFLVDATLEDVYDEE